MISKIILNDRNLIKLKEEVYSYDRELDPENPLKMLQETLKIEQ
jgi:hypothetical protein